MHRASPSLCQVVIWLAVVVAFAVLALRAFSGGVLSLDVSIAKEVQSLPSWLGRLFNFENWLGDGLPLATVTFAASLVLIRRGYLCEGVLVLLTFAMRLTDVVVKYLVQEPRPSAALIHVTYPHDNLSFPSGHVVGVTLVFGLLALYTSRFTSNRAVVIVLRSVCLGLIATIGMARVWSGAHWPSDVLAGYLYGLLFLLPLALATGDWRDSGQRHPRLAPPLGASEPTERGD